MTRLLLGTLLLVSGIFSRSLAAQTCDWKATLLQSFFPSQVDENFLRGAAQQSPQKWHEGLSQLEAKSLRQLVPAPVSMLREEMQLRSVLTKFYEMGFQLYGVKLEPKILIAPRKDLNAVATSTVITFHQGTIEYFLRPLPYLAQMGLNLAALPPAQRSSVSSRFGWKDDWESLYFVLAHEAAHNLMQHQSEEILDSVGMMYREYRTTVANQRKDIASGKKAGVGRWLSGSLGRFLGQFEAMERERKQESEADVVALALLQKAGFDPSVALRASQRFMLLFGVPGSGGWQGAITQALCSDHDDWLKRSDGISRNLSCLRSSGDLCERHVTFPVEKALQNLRDGMASLDSYAQETSAISRLGPEDNLSSESSQRSEIKIELRPKGALLYIDGDQVAPQKRFPKHSEYTGRLPVGRHSISATADGYEAEEKEIIIFPDEQPKVKIELRRKKGN